jgi:peptidyl-prolyl cis-trans isomerase B (cyclophilin B)
MNALVLTLVLLNPVRLYFQPDFPVMIQANEPGVASVKLLLMDPSNQQVAAGEAKVVGGQFDLAAVFPQIWQGRTLFVQAVDAQGVAQGSSLVVAPLRGPQKMGQGAPEALRIYVEQRAVLTTSEGEIVIAFSPEHAPNTVKNFMDLVAGGFYTNVPFHRVIPEFVIQGGDPTGTGTGGPGHHIDLEASSKLHQPGTLSMARSREPDSAGSQFFICLTRERCQHLDKQYAAFGDVVSGMEAVARIAAVPLVDEASGRPVKLPMILSAKLQPAPPRSPAK